MTINRFDFLSGPEAEMPKAPEAASQFLIGTAESALTAPGTLGSFFHNLLDYITPDEKSKNLRRQIAKFAFPQFSGKSLSELKEQEKEVFGEKLAPKTSLGRISRAAGEFAGPAAVTGPLSAESIGLGALGGASGQTARELGLPESVATVAELAAPIKGAIGKKLISPHVEGSLAKGLKGDKLQYYKDLKEIGLSDKQITPLLQSEKKIKTLGILAKKSPETAESLLETKEGVGKHFKPLKEKAASYGNLSQEELKNFNDALKKDLSELESGINPSEYKEKGIEYLQNALKKLEGSIISPEGKKISFKFKTPKDIVDFFQEINEQGLWDKLAPVKNTINDFLKSVDPQLSKFFNTTNKAYSQIINLRERIGVGKHEKMINFIEKAGLLGALAKGLFFGGGWAIAMPFVAENLARRLSTKLLFDPRYQNLLHSFVQAGKQNLTKSLPSIEKKFQNLVKEDFPEEYEDIDWTRSYR